MMSRKVMTAWFAVVGIPLIAGMGWIISRSESHGRSMIILDVPSDIDVVIDDRPLLRCTHEYRAPESCKKVSQPGWSRRYAWSVIRGQTVVVSASRGTKRVAPRTVPISIDGPTPHLRLDDATFEWVDVGGVRIDNGVATFVDHDGRAIGIAGPSEPD
jgi:hypothetical protein